MKQITIRSTNKLLINKKLIEEKLKVKIEIKGKIVFIDGEEIEEFVAEKVIEAMDLGFSTRIALLLAEEDYMFETLSIKSFSKKNPSVIRARIIGTRRKTLDTIEEITNCHVVLHENTVGIIAHVDEIKGAMQAIISLIKGTKSANVYSYLERLNSRRLPFVLQLKKEKGNSKEKRGKGKEMKVKDMEEEDFSEMEDTDEASNFTE